MSKENNPLSAISKAMADAVEKGGGATVLVDGRHRFPATGIAYDTNLILTADHVVDRDEDIRVVLPDGKELSAEVAGRDPSSDLALLRISEAVASPAETFQGDVRVGDLVFALGRHTLSGVETSMGVVSFINGPARTHRGGMIEKFIRTDADPLPGFSGGPLINVEGLVVGVNTSGLAHHTLLTLPVSVAWDTAKTLAEHGSIKRGFLGIHSQPVEIPENTRQVLNREQETGLLLVGIEKDSPAGKSDLMIGDTIVGLAGHPVSDHDELLVRMTGDLVGKPTSVEVLRGGELKSIEVTIGERNMEKLGKRKRRGKHHNRAHRRHHPRK
jgi:S1-C subfamily serine protease